MAKSYLAERVAAEGAAVGTPQSGAGFGQSTSDVTAAGDESGEPADHHRDYGTLSSIFPGFSLSKYARAKRAREAAPALPAGVVEPTEWIKNSGPLQIEPKVWLANERTFLRWQHICVLLGSLAISLYTVAGKGTLAEWMGIGYILIAVFAGCWGYYTLHWRREMILQRSGKDFDSMIGPLIISGALMLSLVLNFIFAVSRIRPGF